MSMTSSKHSTFLRTAFGFELLCKRWLEKSIIQPHDPTDYTAWNNRTTAVLDDTVRPRVFDRPTHRDTR